MSAWTRLTEDPEWCRGREAFPLPAYSEFLPPPWLSPKPYAVGGEMPHVPDDAFRRRQRPAPHHAARVHSRRVVEVRILGQVLQEQRHTDWHRVEQTVTRFTREIAELREQGWRALVSPSEMRARSERSALRLRVRIPMLDERDGRS